MNLIVLIGLFLSFLTVLLNKPRPGCLGVFYIDWIERVQATRIWLKDAVSKNDPQLWSKLTGYLSFLFNPATNPRTILATMMRDGYIRQDPNDKEYQLGLKLVRLGEAAREQIDIRQEALPELQDLASRLDMLVNLVVPGDDEAIYIEQVYSRPRGPISMFTQIGARAPLHCTAVGKCILASMPEEIIDRLSEEGKLVAYTQNTITNSLRLREELDSVRRIGYAVDDEELQLGVRCVASPVCDALGNVIAAVSISSTTSSITPERFPELGALVSETAQRISMKIGCSTD